MKITITRTEPKSPTFGDLNIGDYFVFKHHEHGECIFQKTTNMGKFGGASIHVISYASAGTEAQFPFSSKVTPIKSLTVNV